MDKFNNFRVSEFFAKSKPAETQIVFIEFIMTKEKKGFFFLKISTFCAIVVRYFLRA